jgi:hypothetical protein
LHHEPAVTPARTRRPARAAGADAWLADEVSQMARSEGFGRVGLLTTEKAYAAGTLRRELLARGLQCALPTISERRELVYASELSGDDTERNYHLLAIVRALREREGAPRVLVACLHYELSLAPVAEAHGLILGAYHLMGKVRSHWTATWDPDELAG